MTSARQSSKQSSGTTVGQPNSTRDALQRYFEVALYLLMVAGFGTIAATGKLDAPSMLLVASALVVRGYCLAVNRRITISERVTSLLTGLYVLFYAVDFLVVSRDFVSGTVHLVLFATVVKIFSVRRERDHVYLAVLSFLMVLAAAVLTADSIFLVGFALFMLIGVTTFILMEMKRSSAAAKVQARDGQDAQSLGLWLAAAGPVFMLLILLGGTAIFFLIPRVSAGYLGAYSAGSQLASGFSESVRLGQIGEIQQLNSAVMHVQIYGDSNGAFNLKWRGVSLSTFDGRSWSNPLPQIEAARTQGRFVLPRWNEGNGSPASGSGLSRSPLSGSGSGSALLPSRSPSAKPASPAPAAGTQVRPLHYRVMMEPIGTNVFFLVPRPLILAGPYRQIATDAGGAVFNADHDRAITSYEGTSDLVEPSAAQLGQAESNYSAELVRRYLQTPKVDARVRELARQITVPATTNYDKARAIELYLSSHFGYTLQLGNRVPRDPLAYFLFERQQGHCEYFASSMAIMLRTLGIPSRIVNGFRGGEFNELTGNYVLRGRDAHSWVEVYFPGQGWVSFDPTPPASGVVHSQWNRVLLYLDAAAEFWREWVVNYDFAHQKSLELQGSRSTRALWENFRYWISERYSAALRWAHAAQDAVLLAPRKWTGIGITAVLFIPLLLGAGGLWRHWRSWRLAARPDRSPQLAASIWYGRMTHFLARRGWQKSATQTPTEFVATITDSELRGSVERFTKHYEHARFDESAEDARELAKIFEEIGSAR